MDSHLPSDLHSVEVHCEPLAHPPGGPRPRSRRRALPHHAVVRTPPLSSLSDIAHQLDEVSQHFALVIDGGEVLVVGLDQNKREIAFQKCGGNKDD